MSLVEITERLKAKAKEIGVEPKQMAGSTTTLTLFASVPCMKCDCGNKAVVQIFMMSNDDATVVEVSQYGDPPMLAYDMLKGELEVCTAPVPAAEAMLEHLFHAGTWSAYDTLDN